MSQRDLILDKAREITALLDGMEKKIAFAAMVTALGQMVKHQSPDEKCDETLEWCLRNVRMVATTPDGAVN
jgi:hypothetical protein